jgi:hypothetical protein
MATAGRDRRRGRGTGSMVPERIALLALVVLAACAPVRPEQRAILADKIMRFGGDARARAALEHALENREGSIGGGAVQGGGCGCN